jgi:hypothetical protein
MDPRHGSGEIEGWSSMQDPGRLILDPTGVGDLASDTTLAPRVTSLEGTTLALLDNGKPNGSVLLSEIGSYLKAEYGVRDVVMFTKAYFGTPVEPTQMQEILATCNFAVAAIGD